MKQNIKKKKKINSFTKILKIFWNKIFISLEHFWPLQCVVTVEDVNSFKKEKKTKNKSEHFLRIFDQCAVLYFVWPTPAVQRDAAPAVKPYGGNLACKGAYARPMAARAQARLLRRKRALIVQRQACLVPQLSYYVADVSSNVWLLCSRCTNKRDEQYIAKMELKRRLLLEFAELPRYIKIIMKPRSSTLHCKWLRQTF